MALLVLLGIYFVSCLFPPKTHRSKMQKKVITYIYVLPMFFLVAFRDVSIGPDTAYYASAFNKIGIYSSVVDAFMASKMEKGFVLLEYVFSHRGATYYFFQIFVAFLFYFSFAEYLIKYSEDIPMACFLFLASGSMFGTMNVVRMWLAVAVLLFSVKYISERKLIPFLIVVLLASLFHTSALVFLILYPLSRISVSKKIVVFVIVAAIIVSFMAVPFFDWLTSTLGVYENYMDRFNSSSGALATRLSLMIVLCFFILASLTRVWENSSGSDRIVSISVISYYALIITLAISIVGLTNNIMGRISHYFSIFNLITVPSAIQRIKLPGNKKIIRCCILVGVTAECLVVLFLRPEWYQVLPYRTFL